MPLRTNPANFPPKSPTSTEVTSTATGVLGDGYAGRYIFKVVPAAAFVVGTADQQDATVWITFSAQKGADPTTPAVNTGWALMMGQSEEFILGEGIKFNAISDTTTVRLVWARVGPE